jgi:hypothetical protein
MKNIISYKTWPGARITDKDPDPPPSLSSSLPSSLTMPRPSSNEMPWRESTGAGSNYTNFKVGNICQGVLPTRT